MRINSVEWHQENIRNTNKCLDSERHFLKHKIEAYKKARADCKEYADQFFLARLEGKLTFQRKEVKIVKKKKGGRK